jgi:arsenate reductase
MAEGILRHLAGDRYESFSAGSAPSGYVHSLAILAMQEMGIDISTQHSKSINDFLPPHATPPDLVVSVCESAADNCPTFPGQVDRLHLPFDDPAHAEGTQDEILTVFRRVRDEIRAMIEERFIAPRASNSNDSR